MQQKLQEALVSINGPLPGAVIKSVNSVSGGCIHKAWQLKLNDGRQIFAKTTSLGNLPMLSFEAEGLKALKSFANNKYLEIPEPLACQELLDNSVLLMTWLDLDSGNQENLGKGLAMLHKNSANCGPGHFGWESDGFIGSGPQPGGWGNNWGECFVKLRLLPQLNIAKSWNKSTSLDQLLLLIINFLNQHNPEASLVHGDLWSGNCAIKKNGKGILFDPATWWADREVDIAMTKLFGGFSKDFYIGYESIWPLNESANTRVEIYNLYHLLNHANLFGGSYRNQSISTLNKLSNIFKV